MRTITKVLIAVGAVLAGLAGLWALIAPGQLVKYPSDLNKTAVTTGRFTLYLNPATGLPRAQPEVLPLSINRHIHVVSSTGSQAVVKEDDIEKIGPLPQQDLQQQYVISRTSLQNLKSDQSWAYTPSIVVDRSPAYSINGPFDTGKGPYQVWENETGSSYAFAQQGSSFSRDGITVIPLRGQLTNAPAQPYYLAQLRALGLPTRTTIQRLTPQLEALGLDPTQLTTVLLPLLSPSDRSAITSALSKPIGLRYLFSARSRLVVEPTTGAIVSLDNINQTVSVQPDFAGLTQIGAVLGKPQYTGSPIVRAATAELSKLAKNPPTAPVFNLTYGQTAASVADFASYAKGKANNIDAVETTIPLGLLILGVFSAACGLTIFAVDRRRQPSRMAHA